MEIESLVILKLLKVSVYSNQESLIVTPLVLTVLQPNFDCVFVIAVLSLLEVT